MRIQHNPIFCIGCKACIIACKDINNLAPGKQLLSITTHENFHNGKISVGFQHHSCLQCKDPDCMRACSFGAITITKANFININHDLCVGCGKCLTACQYDAIILQNRKALKCELCQNRNVSDHSPACIAACPYQCLEIVK